VLTLASARRGHFRLESGYHSSLWLDLDALFADPRRVAPLVTALAAQLRPHGVDVVCGPLLGGAFLAQLLAHELGTEFAFTERAAQGNGMFATQYRLPAAFRDRIRGRKVAIVDDVMSAGSSLRATLSELREHGAVVAVAGALLVLGSVGADFFQERGVPIVATAREPYELWLPDECPMCKES
jgi:orotate phosphoribosyltransferase